MLYSYIISKDTVKDYFPETSHPGEYEEGGDATTICTNLVCVKSNKWIDILEKDKHIPFSFFSENDIDQERLDLMISYIEKRTDAKGIYLSPVKKLGENGCEYYCYVGDDSLYVTEKDSYDMKEDLSIFSMGDSFLADNESEGKCYEDSHNIKNIIWYMKKENLASKEISKIYFKNHKLGSDILGIHDKHDGYCFHDLTPFLREQLCMIENGKLPLISIEKKKWPGLIDILIKKEDPIHTPIKILHNLNHGRFHFGNYPSFKEDLKKVEDSKVKVIVTDKPTEMIYHLKMCDIEYLLTENNGIYEITALCDRIPEYSSDTESIEQHIRDGCLNSDYVLGLSPIEQLEVFIDDGYGIKLDKKNMIFTNPYTKNILPQNIIHSAGTLCSGISIPIEDYDPHREVHINIPVKIDIERINNGNVSIHINTHQERQCLEPKFPHYMNDDDKQEYHQSTFDEKELEILIQKLWTRGYLLDDLGLVSILYYDRMHPGSIKKPWWFQHRDHLHADNLLKFISTL